MNKTAGRHAGLDSLRGISILLLALGATRPAINSYSLRHSSNHPLLAATIDYGLIYGGIYLFLVLGGFLITRNLVERGDDGSAPKNFFIRRFLKIVPTYLLVLAGVLIVSLITGAGGGDYWDIYNLATFTGDIGVGISGQRLESAMHSGIFWLGLLAPISLYAQMCLAWGWLGRRAINDSMIFQLFLLGCAAVWALSYPQGSAFAVDAWASGAGVALCVEAYDWRVLRRWFKAGAIGGLLLLAVTLFFGTSAKWPSPPVLDLWWAALVGLCAISDSKKQKKTLLSDLGRYGYAFCLVQIVVARPVAAIWPDICKRFFGLDLQGQLEWCYAFTLGASLTVSAVFGFLISRFWQARWIGQAGEQPVIAPEADQAAYRNAKPFKKILRALTRIRSNGRDRIFLVCCAVVCVILWVAYRLYLHLWIPTYELHPELVKGMFGADGLNKYQWYWNKWGKPDAQARTHQAATSAIAACTIVAAARRIWWRRPVSRGMRRILAIVLAATIGTICGVFFRFCWPQIMQYGGLSLMAIVLLGGPYLRRIPKLNQICTVGTLAMVLGLMVPAFFLKLDFSAMPIALLTMITTHYNGVIGAGDRLAQGQHLLRDVAPLYGVLWPLLGAALDLWWRPLSMGDYVQLVRLLQVIYVLVGAYCLYWVSGRHKIVFFLTVTLGLSNYHFYSLYWQIFVNQSAARHLGMPLGILLMILVRRRSVVGASFILGMGAAVAEMINLEVGITVAIGFAAYLFLQLISRCTEQSAKAFLSAPVLFAAGSLVASAVFLLAHRMVLGYWMELQYIPQLLGWLIASRKTGYSSMQAELSSGVAILIFAHSAAVLIYTAAIPKANSGPRNSLRGGVATMIIVWFAYWANHPVSFYLNCFIFPYGLLLADTLRTILAIRRFGLSTVGVTAVVSVLFVAGPFFQEEMGSAYREIAKPSLVLSPPTGAAVLMSGIWVPAGHFADTVEMKAAYIKGLHEKTPLIYLSTDNYLISKLSGIRSNIPMFDAYDETLVQADYNRLINAIVTSKSKRIYIDSEATLWASSNGNRETEIWGMTKPGELFFYRDLRRDLAEYFKLKDVESGWEVWERQAETTK